ncbi:MAG: hypothetical protein U0984_17850, partial [Prosthecobacter sp.]|nr:hypothetical protein [Prosthecobacter sp.]
MGLLLVVACAFPANAQLGDSIDGSVLADAGEYSYNGRHYDPVELGGAIDDSFEAIQGAVDTVAGAAEFINRSASFGAWRAFNNGSGFIGARGGLGITTPRQFLPRGALQRRQLSGLRFGPFYLTDTYAGAGVLYSEYQGTVRGGRAIPGEDDPWAAIVWASVGASVYVSDTFALSLRPFIYWLPLEGKIGWSGASGFFGMNNASGFIPNSLLEMAYRVPIGAWDLSVYDRFNAALARSTILDEELFYSATVRDMSAHDYAGRYALGGFGVPIADASGRANFDLNDRLFDGNRTYFRNVAGAMLNGRLGEDLQASFFYRRLDQWNEDFEHTDGWNTAGGLIVQERPWITKYAGYTMSKRDNSDSLLQMAYAGVSAQLGPTLSADVMGGYLWMKTGTQSRESAMGRVMLQHQIGPYTNHGVIAGRTLTEPEFGASYLADFVRYYASHEFS